MSTQLPSIDDALEEVVRDERTDTLLGPDGPDGRALAAAVGSNIARYRQKRDMTREELAARAAIDLPILERLEHGDLIPSLRAVWIFATALEVPFGALVAYPGGPEVTFSVKRAGNGRLVASSDNGFRSRALSPLGHPNAPEFYAISLAPHCVEVAGAHAPGTYEHIVVTSGRMIIATDTDTTTLETGDALFFRADVSHRYENPDDTEMTAHLVMQYGSRA